MRNATFDELVEQTRSESKLSTHSSRGIENREYIQQVVKRTYELLWDDYDWEHLRIHREDAKVTLYAGQRLYDFPVNIDINGITQAWVKFGNAWVKPRYGIDYTHMTMIDAENNVRADPVTNWMVRDQNQFEVWPLPASNGNLMAFEGKKKFVQLVESTDRAELDAMCIVLTAASEILMGNNQKDGEIKKKLADARIMKLRARTSSDRRVIVGGSDPHQNEYQRWPRIRAVYNR